MSKLKLYLLALSLIAGAAQADQLYNATLDTSSLAGKTGSLDVALFPGPGSTQDVFLTIMNFSGATYAGGVQRTGAAFGGPLGVAPVTIDSLVGYQSNDLFQAVTYGKSLSFTLDFGGGAVNFPDGAAFSPTQFALYTFADAAGTQPAFTTDPNGIEGIITIAPNGSFSAAALSPNLQFTATPEPATVGLLGLALTGFCALRRRRA